MAKKTCSTCGGKKGRYESWGTHGKGWYKCSSCDGKGFTYTADPPKPKREKKQRKPREPRQPRPQKTSSWREKTCSASGCYNEFRYHIDWTNVPSLCEFHRSKKKAEWREKSCKTSGCSNTVRFHVDWDHPPNFCPSCKESHKQNKRITKGDIYRSGLVPKGWQHAGEMRMSDGHATMYFPGKGTNGKGYRVSWNGHGEPHWTDQGLPSGHPDQHRDPRK